MISARRLEFGVNAAHVPTFANVMTARAAEGTIVADKYRLLERVGSGGMSEVYAAETLDTGRIVALKLLESHRQHDANLAARLFHEAEAVERIRHPSIVRVLDAGESELGPFLVMEYLRGESAAQLLADRGKLELQAALATVLPVLDALHAAHCVGIVHRDLKPGNVFYAASSDGEVLVKLLDFGVAKSDHRSSPMPQTSTGIVMGTVDYLSPEQAAGAYTIDGRSDVFAAGVVLFELLTCTRPFHAPTAVATAYKVAHAPHPKLSAAGGPDDAALQAILDRALAKDANDRFASARDMADALREHAGPRSELQRALRRSVAPTRFVSTQRRPTLEWVPTGHALDAPSSKSTLPPAGRSELRAKTPGSIAVANVRGVVLRAADQYVQQAFGASARARALAALSPDVAKEVEEGMVQAIVSYDVEDVEAYLTAVTQRVCSGNDAWARAAGAAAATGELAPLLRGALRDENLAQLVPRISRVLARLFDFGTWNVETAGATTTIRVSDLGAAHSSLRLWLVGALDGAISAAGARARVAVGRSDSHFSGQLVVEVIPG